MPPTGSALVFDSSNLSPSPALKTPEITVTLFNRWMPVWRDPGTRGELEPDCERYRLVHRPFNDGNFGAGWQPHGIRPLKLGRRQHRVCVRMRILRIPLWYQEDAKAAQEGGGCRNVLHGLSPSRNFHAWCMLIGSRPLVWVMKLPSNLAEICLKSSRSPARLSTRSQRCASRSNLNRSLSMSNGYACTGPPVRPTCGARASTCCAIWLSTPAES